MLTVATLSIATGGCGNSGSGDPGTDGSTGSAEGSGGAAAAGGSDTGNGAGGTIGTGADNSGGTSSGGAAVGSGGTGATGGSQATGGSTTTGGTGAVGGAITGGSQATGGASGASGQSGTGGQAGQGIGGTAQTGGTSGAGGQGGSGGQAGLGTGGSDQTGGTGGVGGEAGGAGRLISFGTLLDPQAVMTQAQQLAQSLADPSALQWQATGDQHRSYYFADANTEEPYRLYVPTDWDGQSQLPLMMFLHGAGSNENTYVDQNNQQMLSLAQQHGFILVSPMGDQGAYGNFLRLTAPFGNEQGAAELMAQVTPESERINELSEQDVINVLELVLIEYPVDRDSMCLAGHSMGSGGTWYIGGKYAEYWNALAPMSGPFVQESGYPWDSVRSTAILVTEGTQTPSLDASRLLRDWLYENGFDAEYLEVNADHGGMVSLVLPDVFDFFSRSRTN